MTGAINLMYNLNFIIMRNLVKQEESKNGKYRVSVYYDEYAESPCTKWDLGAAYLFEYNDHYGRTHRLHDDCSWREVYDTKWDSNKHSLADAVCSIVKDYVYDNDIIKYLRNGTDSYRLVYNRKDRIWQLMYNPRTCGKEYSCVNWWNCKLEDLDASELLENLDYEDYVDLLTKYGKDIYVKDFTLTGYCQGDSVDVFAFCTKEMLEKRSGRNEKTYKTWQEQADAIMECEIDCINHWMWGDVYGYVLEERKNFTKTYEDGEVEEDFEWKEIDSCGGYFEDPDDIIEETLSGYEKEAA